MPVVAIVIGVVAVIGIVWFLRSRSQERTPADGSGRAANAAETGSGGGDSRGSGAGSGSAARVVPVQVATAERKDLPIWLEGLGTVAAVQQVTVRTQVDGRLDKVLFTEGQVVKHGEVLAQIDPRPILVTLHNAQGALERDKAQLEMNQINLKRYTDLKDQNLVASQQVETFKGAVGQFEGSVKIDQSQIEDAQLQLDYAQIKSPLDGIAGIRQVDAGNLVHQTDTNGIVVITAIDPAAVFFTVPQDRLADVIAAQSHGDVTVEVYSKGHGAKLGTGKLAVLDNQVNQTTATLRLKALIANPNHLLWPNLAVTAQLLIDTRENAIVVPTVAIQRGPQGTFVYAVGADKTAQMKPVNVALTAGPNAVIDKGLNGGETVVVEGQNQLRPGGRVQPTNGPGAAGAAGSGAGSGERKGGGKGRRGSGSAEAAGSSTTATSGTPGAQ